MALSRIKIKDVIKISDERNIRGFDYDFFGININKEFMPSVANTSKVDRRKYKILQKKRFVFSGMQTGRDNCIRIGMYDNDTPVLVSPAYTTFEVTNPAILPEYFFMIFRSKEMDRYGAFLSDSSVRSNLDWDRFCDIELTVPPIEIQKKYVAIYEAMLNNLKAYKNGGDDLSLVCNGYIEKLMKSSRFSKLSNLISRVSRKNINGCKNVMGVCSDGIFMKTKANMTNINLANYTLVQPNEFAYNPSRINLGSIAICEKECIVSPMYEVFSIKDTSVLHPLYLHFLLTRPEFLRSTLFYAVGSVRDTFDFDLLAQTEIPLPSYQIQTKIVAIYGQISKRRNVASNLEALTKELCPILVKGAVLEAEAQNQ